jgi:tRNA (guanine9-N1)-methyltransferase
MPKEDEVKGPNIDSQYLNLEEELPRDSLVYLSADSEVLLDTLDPKQIYIIGGIVDHNRHKLLTFTKATSQGLKHGRLPIRESGVQLTTSAILTVNHVFDIIARYHTVNEE